MIFIKNFRCTNTNRLKLIIIYNRYLLIRLTFPLYIHILVARPKGEMDKLEELSQKRDALAASRPTSKHTVLNTSVLLYSKFADVISILITK